MAFSTGGSGGVKADINVTPLVDVVLVLLIIFMVITPMLQRGKEVRLPPAKSFEKEKESDPIILSMTLDKQLYYESEHYKSETELANRLKDEMVKDPTKPIMLKGDERLNYGDVRKVLNRLKESGVKGIGLSVEVEKPKGGT